MKMALVRAFLTVILSDSKFTAYRGVMRELIKLLEDDKVPQ